MSKVSVIIPAYNAAAFAAGALDSVLAQTWQDFEAIVVDDGSKDDTAKVVQPYLADPRVRYIFQHNRGLAAARNTGAKASTGAYLAFLDADDFLAPTAVATMHQRFEESGAAWSIVSLIKLDGQKKTLRRARVPEGSLLLAILQDDFVTRSPFYRREDFVAIGMYDEEMRIREDWDINIRMIAAGKPFITIDEALYLYSRIQGSITTRNRRRVYSYTERLMRKHHKRLADAGDREVARIYAKNLWDLARRYFYEIGEYREGLRCALQSLRYDLSLKRLFHPFIHHGEVALGRRPQV